MARPPVRRPCRFVAQARRSVVARLRDTKNEEQLQWMAIKTKKIPTSTVARCSKAESPRHWAKNVSKTGKKPRSNGASRRGNGAWATLSAPSESRLRRGSPHGEWGGADGRGKSDHPERQRDDARLRD